MGSDNSKEEKFAGGKMVIQLEGNIISFAAGSVIKGTVHVNQQLPFEASDLRVRLFGYERVVYTKWHNLGKVQKTHYKREEIIMFSFPISNWVDG